MRLKYRLAIFDFDGTLADTLPWMSGVFNDVADECGFRRLEPHEFEEVRHLHGRELLKRLEIPLWKLPHAMNAMRRRMADNVGALTLFPGISDGLRALAKTQVKLAVVSSNSRANIVSILGADAALISHFACGVSMFGKSGRLKQVLRASGIAVGSAIYIGDEIRDGEAARDAHMDFGAVGWGMHGEKALREQRPARFFKEPRDIATKLNA
jgi:phosphoglycolate phosphatase